MSMSEENDPNQSKDEFLQNTNIKKQILKNGQMPLRIESDDSMNRMAISVFKNFENIQAGNVGK